MTLRLKILIYVIFSIVLIFVVTVGLVNFRYTNTMINMAHKIADMYTEESAITAKSFLESDLKVSLTLRDILKVLKQQPQKKRERLLTDILTEVLYSNKEFLSVWAVFELNSIDSNWAYPYGRVRYVVFWDKGNIAIEKDSVDLEGDNFTSPYSLS